MGPWMCVKSLHTAARLKINEEFRKNKDETSEENIKKVAILFLTHYLSFFFKKQKKMNNKITNVKIVTL